MTSTWVNSLPNYNKMLFVITNETRQVMSVGLLRFRSMNRQPFKLESCSHVYYQTKTYSLQFFHYKIVIIIDYEDLFTLCLASHGQEE